MPLTPEQRRLVVEDFRKLGKPQTAKPMPPTKEGQAEDAKRLELFEFVLKHISTMGVPSGPEAARLARMALAGMDPRQVLRG